MPWAWRGLLWGLGHTLDAYLGWWQETLSGHTDKVTAAKFKLTMHQAVTGSRDRTVKEWDLGRAYCEAQPSPFPRARTLPGYGGPQPALWEWLQDLQAFGMKPPKAPLLSPHR